MSQNKNGIRELTKEKNTNQMQISNVTNEIKRLYKKLGESIERNELMNAIHNSTLLSINLQKKQGGLRWIERNKSHGQA